MTQRDLKAIVVDDEPLARSRLKALLEEANGVQWIGEAATGARGLELIRSHSPDVAFLDISMPGLSGLDLASRVQAPVHIVFTTAYEQHAVSAFDLRAADYVLKPLGLERIQQAVDRVRALSGMSFAEADVRIYLRDRGRIVSVGCRDISHLEADGDYVIVHAAGKTHLIAGSLTALHERLPPDQFARVHRSHVVNLGHVRTAESMSGARLSLTLASGAVIPVSRSRARDVRNALLREPGQT